MGSISKNMTGTAWHSQQLNNTCKEGSKRCINNNNGICIFKGSLFYRHNCVGKGECEEFESTLGSPKAVSSKSIPSKSVSYHIERTKSHKRKVRKELIAKGISVTSYNQNKQKTISDKIQDFSSNSIKRKEKVIKSINALSNLSNTKLYDYTDEQVDKLFNEIEIVLAEARNKFRQGWRSKV